MNITDGANILRKRQAAKATALTTTAAQIGVASLVMSIGEAITGKKDIKARKLAAEAFEKVQKAIRTLQRQRTQGTDEETEFLPSLFETIKDGAVSLVKNTVKSLLNVMFRLIRVVVPPIINLFLRTLSAVAQLALPILRSVWPALTNPVGFGIAMGIAAWVGYRGYMYEQNRKNRRMAEDEGGISVPYSGSGQYFSAVPEVVLPSNPRGFRNNNPGNIEYVGQAGAEKEEGAGRFAKMKTQAEGLYLLANQLELYGERGINSIHDILHKFAPEN